MICQVYYCLYFGRAIKQLAGIAPFLGLDKNLTAIAPILELFAGMVIRFSLVRARSLARLKNAGARDDAR